MQRIFISLLILTAAAGNLLAETPETVVVKYFEKLKAGGINTVGELMHPEELSKFRQMMLPVIEGGLGSEDAAMFKKFADPDAPSQVRKLSDVEFMNVFMEWVESLKPGMTAVLKNATVEAVGHVREGDVSHVVVRMKVKHEGIEIEKLSVLSVKDFQGVPKMLLTGEIKGMAEALKRKK